ncbi:MAG: NUDIX domain-containing protein [Kiritimatiellae bacterium]|nr:NUDIX domain-containing protein [Kiritimatiellia bacterium]
MSYENANIETIARGICLKEKALLVCQPAKGGRCYLPGGHIEFNETARQALEREIAEEMGLTATAGAFLGVTENAFQQQGEQHCEINLLFALDIPEITPEQDPPATESWIAFRWVPFTIEALREANLLPAHLIDDLTTRLQTPDGCPFHIENHPQS